MEVFESGIGDVLIRDPDENREWMRRKPRALQEKVMDEREAVRKFVGMEIM